MSFHCLCTYSALVEVCFLPSILARPALSLEKLSPLDIIGKNNLFSLDRSFLRGSSSVEAFLYINSQGSKNVVSHLTMCAAMQLIKANVITALYLSLVRRDPEHYVIYGARTGKQSGINQFSRLPSLQRERRRHQGKFAQP